MSVRLEDLPKGLQAQVLEKAGLPAKRTKDRTGANTSATDGFCWECGEHFTSTRRWEEHTAANPGHRRLELIAERTA